MKSPFFDKETLFTLSWLRVTYFVLFAAAFLITEAGRFIYRPYIYENNIADYGLANTIGNLMGVVTQIFFSLAILHSNRIKGLRIIVFITVGYIVYEIIQPYTPRGTFDQGDLLATVLGGIMASLIFLLIHAVAVERQGSGETNDL